MLGDFMTHKQRVGEEENQRSLELVSPKPIPDSSSFDLKELGRKAAEEAEKEHIRNTLTYTNWNRKAAAKLLQISYKALLYKIKKNQLDNVNL
jgi:transcriptional regulator with PAS, ATPase and Fis domain